MMRGMRDRGLTPLVTLHHFTNPLWFEEIDSWENEQSPVLFEKFVKKAVQALKEYCTLWFTLNEPSAYALNGYVGGGLIGNWPPGKNDLKLAMQVQANMIRGHVAAYRTIHQIQPEARVGMALNYRSFKPHHRWSPLDHLLTKNAHVMINAVFPMALAHGVIRSALGTIRIPEAKGTQDFFGFNYYTKNQITFDLRRPVTMFTNWLHPRDAELSDRAFLANEPEGMLEGLKWIVGMFPNLPIIVSENGIPDAEDRIRPRYITQHIHQMWRAVNFNWPIKGYFHWTLVDNFEWDQGWTLRFGLWALEEFTQKRTKRHSAELYAEICKENGLTSEMVQKYCPEVFEKLFPV
jgi:beta-glucosidase